MTTGLIVVAALLCDWLFGEPTRWHPLVGLGRLAGCVEHALYGSANMTPCKRSVRGVAAVLLLLVPVTALVAALRGLPHLGWGIDIFVLYAALGHKSLHEHASAVSRALATGDDAEARRYASHMVSRDAEVLDTVPATIESVLENGNDAVFGALFWFVLAGAPGAVLYRLANTLDAMWGYRNERYRDFGWAAARLDDVLNYVPARLTAMSYALLGKTWMAFKCWHMQAPQWKSPNAGPVMASGAGALEIMLGGPARYDGVWCARPALGTGRLPDGGDVARALALIRRSVFLWVAVIFGGGLLHA
ncbi:MAG: cobalamin biosynthesis protein [Alphaproteobacteria bacterium]|nr:cobalamin biosynthesis protein [Alphaproteobacteria bacterium]MBU6471641.1 cobalamin biosynthesis protein [Alphaproteobacteria bacterium]MDE2494642.1 cobalamin biosynthesis protein [Alphaproteobacteria bacterium]